VFGLEARGALAVVASGSSAGYSMTPAVARRPAPAVSAPSGAALEMGTKQPASPAKTTTSPTESASAAP